ncbi:hypothetical protein AGOR_G00208670 [Albula goreensis]|uniref:RUN and SH3 domain-containing protein 1 n=1 Tax=Albula goreensis TaxID=1534307 RepID=A0A8T3CTC8_9TELE|nr:hypothetical protein AGOR_G00208670 [Albula goreensis]
MDHNEGDDEEEDDDDEDDDTLVPSCRDCPPSLLEFSLTSSTSSSSTSISSCSDFEADGPDAPIPPSSLELAPEESLSNHSQTSLPQVVPPGPRPPPPLPPLPPCSPDEGYPSARCSPSSDFPEGKGSLMQECTRLDLFSLLDSIDELGKRELFNQVVQVARWELQGDLELRDRLNHLQKLEQVNVQVKIAHLERLQEAGLDFEIRKLLVLAGLTQAELLKLSPELGVCVTGVLEDGDEELSESTQPVAVPKSLENGEDREEKEAVLGAEIVRDEWSKEDRLREGKELTKEDEHERYLEGKTEDEENRETFRTTSFTEMARRRKRNGSNGIFSCNCGHNFDGRPNSDSYYSTAHCNTINSGCNKEYECNSVAAPPPPPPPPRPLPPCPPALPLPPLKPPLSLCTIPANASRPERFDWLIAFSPDTETPPFGVEKSSEGSPQKSSTGSKVTTFKELRYRSRQNPQPVVVQPEPDPTVITPDPDFLYNLKWRREKTDGDGSQWEYTSQAHSTFLQPQPTRSLSILKEMLRMSEGGSLQESCPSQRIGPSTSEGNLWIAGGEREGKKEKEEEGEVRGRADGGRNWESRITVRSVSFAGSVQRGEAWMAGDVRGSLGGQGPSSLCLQEKRALLSAVSVAVEAILAQFSSSRTLVQKSFKNQKAQSGDSSINPSLGRLVLQCLCPALHGLLCDGLKPHQSDLIAGRRPNSPWGLVQASTRPGPSTQALHSLQCRVAELPQLRQSRHRFNAFLLGLLNIKLLDYWLSHLQSCHDVLVTYYRPTSFMRLSHTSCRPLFEELLLLLQPLSLLTFSLDLLFQHHHLDPASPGFSPASHSPETPSPANQDGSFRVSPKGFSLGGRQPLESVSEQDFTKESEPAEGTQNATPSASANHIASGADGLASHSSSPGTATNKGDTSPQLLWLQEKEIVPPGVSTFSQQAGQAIQQGWGAVVRWGERLGQNLGNYYTSGAVTSQGGKSPSPSQEFWLGSSSSTLTQPDLISHQPQSDPLSEISSPTIPWGLGRLFGASGGPRSPQTRTPPARRPSHWLAPGVSVLTRFVGPTQNPVPEDGRTQTELEGQKDTEETGERARPLRSVRTLCDHTGTGEELSFQKGEELTVLEGVDSDWVRCRRGDKEGLVPIGYTSLIM